MSNKANLDKGSSTYKRNRDQSADDKYYKHLRPSSTNQVKGNNRYMKVSKSSTKSISDLLAADKNSVNLHRSALRNKHIKIDKNTAVKKLMKTLNYHSKLVVFESFSAVKRFEGFLVQSSDDSLVQLGTTNRNFHNENYGYACSLSKQSRQKDNSRKMSSTINLSKSSNHFNGSHTARLPKEEDMFEKSMREYIVARESIKIANKQFNDRNYAKKKSPSRCRGKGDVSPEILSKTKTGDFRSKFIEDNRKSYVNVVDIKLDYKGRNHDFPRKSIEPDRSFQPTATSKR